MRQLVACLPCFPDMVLTWCLLALVSPQSSETRDEKLFENAEKGNDFECKALVLAGANLNYTSKVSLLPLATEGARGKQSVCCGHKAQAVVRALRLCCSADVCFCLLSCCCVWHEGACAFKRQARWAEGERAQACVCVYARACLSGTTLCVHARLQRYTLVCVCSGSRRGVYRLMIVSQFLWASSSPDF